MPARTTLAPPSSVRRSSAPCSLSRWIPAALATRRFRQTPESRSRVSKPERKAPATSPSVVVSAAHSHVDHPVFVTRRVNHPLQVVRIALPAVEPETSGNTVPEGRDHGARVRRRRDRSRRRGSRFVRIRNRLSPCSPPQATKTIAAAAASIGFTDARAAGRDAQKKGRDPTTLSRDAAASTLRELLTSARAADAAPKKGRTHPFSRDAAASPCANSLRDTAIIMSDAPKEFCISRAIIEVIGLTRTIATPTHRVEILGALT